MRNYYRVILLLLFIGGIALGAYDRSLTAPLVLLGVFSVRFLYRVLGRASRFVLLAPCLIALAVVLAGLYSVADLALLAHSSHTSHCLHDALCVGGGSSLAGLLAAWVEQYKGLPLLAEAETNHLQQA